MAKDDIKNVLKTSRIEALSDGIFAIAMTILILSFETILNIPSDNSETAVIGSLSSLWPDFVHYVESFVILGAFWYQQHRQFHYIKNADSILLFINIIGLMFIGLIPFTTVIVSDYGHLRAPSLLFEINLFVAGLIFFFHWIYGTYNRYLTDADLDKEIISFYRKRNLIIPAVSLLAMLISFFRPRLGTFLYFLVPGILIIWKRK